MPTLEFKGKSHIYAHHLTAPYRPLQVDPSRSMLSEAQREAPLIDQNLIIHGDNLQALKALLPHYAGRVKCIYIDPPYNTGKEGWVYNDRVNSPLMQDWFAKNSPVDGEDLERHDKWLCMMWPRLHLLKELLADDGAIFVSIDDNEAHHLRMMMDEIFGEDNFIAQIVVRSNPGGRDYGGIAWTHEYIVAYGCSEQSELLPIQAEELPLVDEYGRFKLRELRNRNIRFNSTNRPNLYYPFYVNPSKSDENRLHQVSLIQKPGWIEVFPLESGGVKTVWRWQQETVLQTININVMGKMKRDGDFQIVEKYRKTTKRERSILDDKLFRNEQGTITLKTLFGSRNIFPYPKSEHLIKRIIQLSTPPAASARHQSPDDIAIVLDSFAGSGTTAHAVLAQNKADGGNRRFILIECEDYADSITAERVRRVIQGVPKAKDRQLREGLGGSFAYCALGQPIDINSLLTGENLPTFSTLAAYLLYTATGVSAAAHDLHIHRKDGHFYADDQRDYYLIYEPNLDFLRSGAAALNLERAKRIRGKQRPAMVFAPAKFIGQRQLSEWDITFCQLPYELMAKAGG